MSRIIMHIDFNSYFATVEQQDHPEWRGKPVGVCEHLGGIIIAASVQAKRWGIRTGTPVWEAKRLYPKIILAKTHPNRYRMYTARFLQVLSDYTNSIEKYSIDEAFLDITNACTIRVKHAEFGIENAIWVAADPFAEAQNIAKEIQQRITREVGDYLTCSVGIGWNKLVAKIASDMQKPNGLVVLRPEDKERMYSSLALTDIPGIARRQERNLKRLGIYTLRDLAHYPVTKLVARFGIMGYHLYRIGQFEGSWNERFAQAEPIKSIGHVYTIPHDFRHGQVAESVLYKLCEMVAVRLRNNRLAGTGLYVHLFDGTDYIGKAHKLSYGIYDGRDIFLESKAIFKRLLAPASMHGDSIVWPNQVRQIGVTATNLIPLQHQPSLFGFDEKKRRLVAAMDAINEKYEGRMVSMRQTAKLGDNHEGVDTGWTIARLPVHQARHIIRDSIGFGRMKEFTPYKNI